MFAMVFVPAASADDGEDMCQQGPTAYYCVTVINTVFHSGLCEEDIGVVVNDEPHCIDPDACENDEVGVAVNDEPQCIQEPSIDPSACGDHEVGAAVNGNDVCIEQPSHGVEEDSSCDYPGDSYATGLIVTVDGDEARTGCYGLEDRCGDATGWWIVIRDSRGLATTCFLIS